MLPPSTHGSNIRGIVTATTWDALRIPVADAAGGTCHICGTRPMRRGRAARPDCHEKWTFHWQDGRPVQALERLVALCPGCHEVQHSGRAFMRGRLKPVIDRLQQLNGWRSDQAADDVHRAAARCRVLDQYRWDLDLTALQGTVVVPGHDRLYFTAAERERLGKSWLPATR